MSGMFRNGASNEQDLLSIALYILQECIYLDFLIMTKQLVLGIVLCIRLRVFQNH